MSAVAIPRQDIPLANEARRGLRGWIVRHPLSAFLILLFSAAFRSGDPDPAQPRVPHPARQQGALT